MRLKTLHESMQWAPLHIRKKVTAWADALQEYLKEEGFPTQRPYEDEVVVAGSYGAVPHTRMRIGEDGSVEAWHAGDPRTTKPFNVDIHDPDSFPKIKEFVGRYNYEA